MTAEPPADPSSDPQEPRPPRRSRRRRWLTIAVIVVVVLAVGAFVASRINLPYYSVAPGTAQAVAPLVTVPPGKGSPVEGQVLLTDVLLARVNLLTYLPDRLSSDTALVPADEVLSPFTPPDQLLTQGYLQMATSQAAAETSAFRRLGYSVPAHDEGTQIYSVAAHSPASNVLKVGQVVTAVDSAPTPSVCDFVAALHERRPGDVVKLAVEQTTVTTDGKIVPGRTVDESVRLAKPPEKLTTSGCPGVTGPTRAYLGVEIQTYQTFSYPFKVSVATSDIGGPSAGLAMCLGIIDKLSGGHLTGGATVAATGTITTDGVVGDVGGVAQKTIAVERAGATVFFVPATEYRTAQAKATSSLHVYGVRSLDQVLGVLKRLGGTVPPPPTVATSPPVAPSGTVSPTG